MIKDMPKGLLNAVTAINQKSREAFVAEQQAMMAKKLNKLPKPAMPKADPAAHASASKMAEAAEGSVPRNEKEKRLAAMKPPRHLITHGDVLHGRGVRKEEANKPEQIDELSKKTLRSYMAKAVGSKTAHDYGVGVATARGLDDLKKTSLEKSKRRSDGLIRAIVKTTKEEVEQIDELSHEKMTSYMRAAKKDINKNLRGGEPEPGSKRDMKVKKRVDGYRKAWAKVERQNEEVEMVDEGKRLISKHGDGAHTAKVYKDTEYNEYQVHFFKNGKHMGEGPVSYHDDKDDAQNTAESALKKMNEERDTPGNSAHQCAIHVKSEQFGDGRTLTSQHAEPDADGHIAWYDVMFTEGIKRVYTKDIEVLVSESHMNHKKKKGM